MISRGIRLTCMAIISFSHFAAFANSDDFQVFRDAYVKNSAKLLEASTHVKGQVVLTTINRDSAGKIVRKTVDQGDFASSNRFGKLELSADRSSGGRNRTIDYVFALADDQFYTLSKRSGESEYTVDAFGNVPQPGARPSEYKPIDYKIYIGLFLKSSHRYFDSELWKMLNPAIIDRFESKPIQSDGKNLVRVSFTLKADPMQGREFDVEPEHGYRIVRSASSHSGTTLDSTVIEYDEKTPYFPKLIKQITPQLEVNCELSNLQFEPTPENEFIPSFHGIQNSQARPNYSTVRISAVTILIAAFGFTIWRRFL